MTVCRIEIGENVEIGVRLSTELEKKGGKQAATVLLLIITEVAIEKCQ
jgi:hypothetical protein